MKKFGILLMATVLILVLVACADTPEAHIHEYDEGQEVKEATCTEDGLMTFTCGCGHSYDEVILAGHNWLVLTCESPTCTQAGMNTYSCVKCEETYSETFPATGHQYNILSWIQEPTCMEDGFAKMMCACGEYSEDIITFPKWGHSYRHENTEDATCTEEGKATYTCSYGCGKSYTETIPKLGHDWSEWEQTIEPNVAMDGLEERYCYHCYIDETRVLEKLAGDFTLYPAFVAHLDWQGLSYFDSPDDLETEDVFAWATWLYLRQFAIESDEDYPGYPQTYRVEDLDAFTLACLGRTYDYSQMQGDYDVEYIYNAEKGTITAVYGGAGGIMYCPPIYESHTQLDATHYAIYYYNDCGNECDFTSIHGQRSVILVEIRDGSYIIVSHTSA